MRRIIAITSILMLFIVLSSSNTTSMIDNGVIIQPIPSGILDLTAPMIFLNISQYNSTGLIFGEIIELESNIHNYTIELNGTDLTSSVATLQTSQNVTFSLNANNYFDTTPGFHNYLVITAFNDADNTTTLPSFKQGGGVGGYGGFMFCDDAECWGPIPFQPDTLDEQPQYNNLTLTDYTAPVISFNLIGFPCCGNVTPYPTYDPDSGMDSAFNDYTVDDTITTYAKNTAGVSCNVTVTWAALETIDIPPEENSYAFFSGFIFVALYLIYARRKKTHNSKR
ncbi:MAG: hypothetical protein KAU62_05620 [Candidatus Heimdallarchaeota archaeon]|nr:hypothetical protein [Candidatus Heimdallarchaeota archaeon]MCG3255544.1 hypothetical protein [Candidatus Heimdallarchaeota archaeon]MCK4610619.1 hypothetical protein [Candidatus Heimdallarchaeota archaeon]